MLMQRLLREFLHDDEGATAIEYGLLVALLAFAIISGASTLGNAIVFLWSDNTSRLVQAIN